MDISPFSISTTITRRSSNLRSSSVWIVSLLVTLICSSEINNGVLGTLVVEDTTQSHHHLVQLNSLLPSSFCSASPKDHDSQTQGVSLKVVHKHGPCSPLSQLNAPTPAEVLSQDEARVNSLQTRLGRNRAQPDSAADLPAKSGGSLGTGNFIVKIGLGKPKKDISVIFDTGSALTWTQCQPCVGSCYKQLEPIFNPIESNSYKNTSCNSAECSLVFSSTGNPSRCSGSTCVYGIQYGDRSYSAGFLATDELTLTPTDVVPNFLFGCGQNNNGLFGGAAGLLGLCRNNISIVYQTASKYGKYFSYCLPSPAGSTGHLTLGKSGTTSGSTKFTPMLINSQYPLFYFIQILGIRVGRVKLRISKSVFAKQGTIIDSGTVITRLPPKAYSALRAAFRKQMKKYPITGALSILDTCYDLSNYSSVSIPAISFYFSGAVEVPIDVSGILYLGNVSQACLAFAANSEASLFGIFGNVQQHTLEVVYDVAGSKLGFGTGGCACQRLKATKDIRRRTRAASLKTSGLKLFKLQYPK